MADSDWAELPHDILISIAQRLIFVADHYSFSRVCSSWRTAALRHRGGLNLPNKISNPCLILLPFDGERDTTTTIQRPLLSIPFGDLCRGSHHQGWLVMVKPDLSVYLLNPFSGTRIHDLPPVTALPNCGGDRDRDPHRFYIVNIMGEIFVCNNVGAPEPTLSRLGHKANDGYKGFWHLVESAGGKFLAIRRCSRPRTVKETTGFQVYELKLGRIMGVPDRVEEVENLNRVEEVENLNGEALFLGKNQPSFSLSRPCLFGYKGSRIYFTDGNCNISNGAFNVENSTMEYQYRTGYGSAAIWINPRP